MVYFKNPKSKFRVHTWLPISTTLYYLLTWSIHKLLKAIFSSLMIASRAPAMKAHKDFFSLKNRKLPKNYSIHAKKCIGYQKPPSSCTRLGRQQLSKFKIQNFFSTFWRPPQASEMSADDDSNSNLNLTYWFNVPGAGSFWCWLL